MIYCWLHGARAGAGYPLFSTQYCHRTRSLTNIYFAPVTFNFLFPHWFLPSFPPVVASSSSIKFNQMCLYCPHCRVHLPPRSSFLYKNILSFIQLPPHIHGQKQFLYRKVFWSGLPSMYSSCKTSSSPFFFFCITSTAASPASQ